MRLVRGIRMGKKVVIISGINLIDGGPISIYLDFLASVVQGGYSDKFKIIALVGKKELFSAFENEIELIEFRKSKQAWLYRLYYEYIYFNKLSQRLKPYIWISLHDVTPNVKSVHRYVYCHNPSPFHKMGIKDVKYGVKYYLFSKLYKYLYAINIRKNDAVIVQQDWMRKEFIKMYKLKKVIVARPSVSDVQIIPDASRPQDNLFVCPSFPRYYKNFQVVCEAAKILENSGINNFKLIITVDGTENKYASSLKQRYGNLETVYFCGLLSRKRLFELYAKSHCLVFMSKLETWGMPITEFKSTGKPIIAADLPYAHETVGNYDNVEFVHQNDYCVLAEKMKEVIKNHKLSGKSSVKAIDIPYAKDWMELNEIVFH